MGSAHPQSIVTPKSVVEWSPDGTTVTKRAVGDHVDEVLGPYRAAIRNEIRVNRMLSNDAPPVAIPQLLSWSGSHRSMTFEAVDGKPLGPKFPTELAHDDVLDLIELGHSLHPYQPRRRWFRRLDVDRRLRHHVLNDLVTPDDADAISSLASDRQVRWRFAHADLTARNVLRRSDGRLVLIDWEWAGLYPTGYELAFLWFSLSDVPGGRVEVENTIARRNEAGFLVSALLIQLLHLHFLHRSDSPFLSRHWETRDDLLRHLHGRESSRG